MKISKSVKLAIGAALLLPAVMYANDVDVIEQTAKTLTGKFINNAYLKTVLYSVEGAIGLGTYIWQRNWMTLAGLGVVFLYINILTGIM